MSNLQNVIASNLARQRRAQELNNRVGGDAAIFPVLNLDEMRAWYMPRLAAARRAVEINDFKSLLLPPLDEAEVSRVLAECPDTIMLLGEEHEVNYDDGCASVTLLNELTEKNRWIDLPDEGVSLPGGKSVVIRVSPSGAWSSYRGADIPLLKEELREFRNLAQWERRDTSRWPTVPMPDISASEPEISLITTVYGRCVVTGQDLLAFGTVEARQSYYNQEVELFAVWLRSREEAEGKRNETHEMILKERERKRLAAKADELRAEVEQVHQALKDLTRRDGYHNVSVELRDRLHRMAWVEYRPYDLEKMEPWLAQARALMAETEAAYVAAAERKAEAERLRLAAEAGIRAELAPILESGGPWGRAPTLEEAPHIRAFAEAGIKAKSGNRESALRAFARESEAEYGRQRRQEEILRGFPGLERTEPGQEFARLHRADDVNAWLTGAVAWLRHLGQKKAEVTKSTSTGQSTTSKKAPTSPGELNLSGWSGVQVTDKRKK